MIELTIKVHGQTTLYVKSDGHAHYEVRGKNLRDFVDEYKTEDDMHIVGLVTAQLNAYNAREYLDRRLYETRGIA